MTEREIFEGIAKKDNETFLYLYQKYQGKILHMVQKNNGNQDDALDIFQEGIISLWTNIAQGKFQVKDQAKISTYLYTLCRNIWISKLRKRKVMVAVDNQADTQMEESKEMLEQQERITELEDKFRKLDENCRNMLSMFYYKKSSLKEIAANLGITEKTAKNNKYRCMQRLRALY